MYFPSGNCSRTTRTPHLTVRPDLGGARQAVAMPAGLVESTRPWHSYESKPTLDIEADVRDECGVLHRCTFFGWRLSGRRGAEGLVGNELFSD